MAVQWEILGPALGALALVGKVALQAGRVLRGTELALASHGVTLGKHERALENHEERIVKRERVSKVHRRELNELRDGLPPKEPNVVPA